MVKKDCTQSNVRIAAKILKKKTGFLHAIIRANRREQDAEDILHNVFLSLITIPALEHIKCIDSYLCRIVINDVIDIRRKSEAYGTALREFLAYRQSRITNDFIRTIITKDEFMWIFHLAETNLPPYLLVPFSMRYKHECGIADISKKTGIAKNVIRVYLSTALKRMREVVKTRHNAC